MAHALGLLLLLGVAAPVAAQGGRTGTAALEARLRSRPADAALYVQLGAAYETEGRGADAEALLRQGLDQASDPAPVRAALVELLARGERWADALAVVEPVRTDAGWRGTAARLRVNAGLAAYRAGDRAAARTQWARALEEDPGLAEAAVNLGALLLETGARADAAQVAGRALRHHPTHPQLLALRAATLDGAEGVAAAIAALRRRRAETPGDEAVGLELAGLLAAAGDRPAAVSLLDTLARAPRASEPVFALAGDLLLDGGQAEGAAAVLDSAVARFPRSGALWLLLGEAEAGRARWTQAAAAYARAARLLDAPGAAQLALVETYAAAGDTGAAGETARELLGGTAPREVLLQLAGRLETLGGALPADTVYAVLLGRDPDDVDALVGMAGQQVARGDSSGAAALFTRAARNAAAGPEPFAALLALTAPGTDSAAVLLRRAVWRGLEALQALELQAAALAGGPVGPRALARARPVLERQRRVAQHVRQALDTMVDGTPWGAAELGRARQAYPHSALLARYAATAALRDGQPAVALALYDEMLRRAPQDAELQQGRGEVLTRLGRPAEAIGAFARAFELAPEADAAFRTLVRLHQEQGTLADLLDQVRRLRIRFPDLTRLLDQEIEVLHRLGRLADAERLIRERREDSP